MDPTSGGCGAASICRRDWWQRDLHRWYVEFVARGTLGSSRVASCRSKSQYWLYVWRSRIRSKRLPSRISNPRYAATSTKSPTPILVCHHSSQVVGAPVGRIFERIVEYIFRSTSVDTHWHVQFAEVEVRPSAVDTGEWRVATPPQPAGCMDYN